MVRSQYKCGVVQQAMLNFKHSMLSKTIKYLQPFQTNKWMPCLNCHEHNLVIALFTAEKDTVKQAFQHETPLQHPQERCKQVEMLNSTPILRHKKKKGQQYKTPPNVVKHAFKSPQQSAGLPCPSSPGATPWNTKRGVMPALTHRWLSQHPLLGLDNLEMWLTLSMRRK